MTRKTALKRMINGQAVFHPDFPDIQFRYDESEEKEEKEIHEPIVMKRPLESGFLVEEGGVWMFFSLPNLGWKTTNQHFS